jgi:hypothetical protein
MQDNTATSLQQLSAALLGSWQGQETLHASPWSAAGQARANWEFSPGPGGLHLLCHYRQQTEAGKLFELHGVMMAEPGGGELLWFCFDSYGYAPLPPLRGNWDATRQELRLQRETARGRNLSCLRLAEQGWEFEIAWGAVAETGSKILLQGHYRRP